MFDNTSPAPAPGIDVDDFLAVVTAEVTRINDLDAGDIEISLDSLLVDGLDLDSLGVLELVMRLQTRYGITIPEDSVKESSTVRDFLDFIERGQSQ